MSFSTNHSPDVIERIEYYEHHQTSNDVVNHPDHYTQGDIECIDAIKASMSHDAFCGYLKGNTLKYIWRYQYKKKPIEDLNKALWYLNKLISETKETKIE